MLMWQYETKWIFSAYKKSYSPYIFHSPTDISAHTMASFPLTEIARFLEGNLHLDKNQYKYI